MDISLRFCSSCVQSSMLCGSKTWPVTKENKVTLQQAEMRMIGSVMSEQNIKFQVKRERPGIDNISLVLQRNSCIGMGMCCKKKTVIG